MGCLFGVVGCCDFVVALRLRFWAGMVMLLEDWCLVDLYVWI